LNFEEDEEDESRKLSNKLKEELLRKLCHYCERPKCSNYCAGFCKRPFHEICKTKIEDGAIAGADDNVIDFEIPESHLDDEELKNNMNTEFICRDCQNNLAICFKCKKKGSFYPELSSSKSKGKGRGAAARARHQKKREEEEAAEGSERDDVSIDPETASQKGDGKPEVKEKFNELIKCSTANCNKFFHYECIKDNPLFKFFDANKHKKFRCSLHYCAKCKISGDTMAIAQCLRCPRAYHLKCYPRDKVHKINKKSLICQDHKYEKKVKPKEEPKKANPPSREGRSTRNQMKLEKGSGS